MAHLARYWQLTGSELARDTVVKSRPYYEDEPLPDQYLIYDRNVEGPRGRFGRWSFAGTTRFFGEGQQGKDTFVGGMVVDEPTRRHPLNAALQVVTNQYRLEPRKPYEGNCRRWRECRYLSQDEPSETFYLDKPERFRSTEIVLRDKASIETEEQEPLTYAKGTRQFFTVEVLPDGCTPADSVRRIATPEGLRGLEVGAGGHWLLLVHNTTDAPIALDTVLPWAEGPLTLHTSGSHEPAGEPLGASDGRVQLDIPAHSHVVVEKRP